MKDNKEKPLSDAQRKALAEEVENIMMVRIQDARDRSGELRSEIAEKVKKELGVTVLEKKIENLKNQIGILDTAKQKLGFTNYGEIENGTKAYKLLTSRLNKKSQEVSDLLREKNRVTAQLWLADSAPQAQRIVSQVMKG